LQLVRRANTASTAVRRAVVSRTHRAVRWTDSATAVTAGLVPPAITPVPFTCTGLAVRTPAAVSTEVAVTRCLDGAPVRRDTSDSTANSVSEF